MAGFTLGLGWGLSQTPSWAAPGQNPYMQTVPTRLPTSVLTPVPGVPPVEDDDVSSSSPDGTHRSVPSPIGRASLLLCLCPIGLGLGPLLVLGGIFLLKRS
jgi:hypothetical protein